METDMVVALEDIIFELHDEADNIVESLKNIYNSESLNEIIALVELKTFRKRLNIIKNIEERFIAVDELLSELPKLRKKKDFYVFRKKYFSLINPVEVAKDLDRAFVLDEIKREYLLFLDKLSCNQYGEIFLNYYISEKEICYIKNILNWPIIECKLILSEISQRLTEYFEILNEIRDKKRLYKRKIGILKDIILEKIAQFVAPIISWGGFWLLEEGSKELEYVNDTVFDLWEYYKKRIYEIIDEVYLSMYSNVLMCLYGGMFLNAAEDFENCKLKISDIFLGSYTYKLDLLETEKLRVEDWLNKNIEIIKSFWKEQKYSEAVIVCEKMISIIEPDSITAKSQIFQDETIIYTLSSYLVASKIFESERLLNIDVKSFCTIMKDFYKNINIVPDDEISKSFGKPTLLEQTVVFINVNLEMIKNDDENKEPDFINYIVDYVNRNYERIFLKNSFLSNKEKNILKTFAYVFKEAEKLGIKDKNIKRVYKILMKEQISDKLESILSLRNFIPYQIRKVRWLKTAVISTVVSVIIAVGYYFYDYSYIQKVVGLKDSLVHNYDSYVKSVFYDDSSKTENKVLLENKSEQAAQSPVSPVISESIKQHESKSIDSVSNSKNIQDSDSGGNDTVEIIKDSSNRVLKFEELSGLSLEQIELAKLEIYARHGYPFKSQVLADYFSGFSWYKPNENFNENELSAIEKENIKNIDIYIENILLK